MIQLNLPNFAPKLKKTSGRLMIYDQWRKKYVVLTPEEWVRQHFVAYLNENLKVPSSLIALERGSRYSTSDKRTDIVAYDPKGKPYLLVECKASHLPLNDKVLLQLISYNAKQEIPLLAITNGIEHLYFKFCNCSKDYRPIAELPGFQSWEKN